MLDWKWSGQADYYVTCPEETGKDRDMWREGEREGESKQEGGGGGLKWGRGTTLVHFNGIYIKAEQISSWVLDVRGCKKPFRHSEEGVLTVESDGVFFTLCWVLIRICHCLLLEYGLHLFPCCYFCCKCRQLVQFRCSCEACVSWQTGDLSQNVKMFHRIKGYCTVEIL